MKTSLITAALVLGIGIVIFLNNEPPVPDHAPASAEAKVASQKEITILTDTPFAKEFGKPETSELRELELIQLAFQDYLSFVKKDYRWPIGDNRDFTTLLTGVNPFKVAPIPPGHARINGEGELTDRRGIPFVVHPLSELAIEVRAAGVDGKIWTDDDLVNLSPIGQALRPRVLEE